MQILRRNDVALAFEDSGGNFPSMILVHGLGCNRSFLVGQARFFQQSHRVVSVDLRGHGASDAPECDYTMQLFCEDLAWLAEMLALDKPVVVGHSMGGNIALMLAKLYPALPSSVVLIDSVIFPRPSLLAELQSLGEAMQGPDYLETLKQTLRSLCLPSDRLTEELIASVNAPRYVVSSALLSHVERYDSSFAASVCCLPVAYISATTPLCDLERFKMATRQLVTAQTLGSGHFSPAEVPDQINAMIERFLAPMSMAESFAGQNTEGQQVGRSSWN